MYYTYFFFNERGPCIKCCFFLRYSDLNRIDVTLLEFATFMCRADFFQRHAFELCNVFHAQTFSESEIPTRVYRYLFYLFLFFSKTYYTIEASFSQYFQTIKKKEMNFFINNAVTTRYEKRKHLKQDQRILCKDFNCKITFKKGA